MLSMALGCTVPLVVSANSGGVINKPNNGDYTGSLDGVKVTASNGNVIIDSIVTNDARGGYATGTDAASDNTITIQSGGNVNGLYGGKADSGDSTGNKVFVNGGNVNGNIDGGRSDRGSSFNNTVEIIGGTVLGSVYAGSTDGDATNNSIIINNGSFAGAGRTITIDAGYSRTKNAINNTVTIVNSQVANAEIYGGYADAGKATGNTIKIQNNVTLGSNVSIYGGYSPSDAFTDNTLEWGTITTIKSVQNFNYYNFTIPDGTLPGDTLLKIVGGAETNLDKAKVQLVAVQGDRQWVNGESVTLINNDNGIIGEYELISGQTLSGIRMYDYTLTKDNNNIFATIGQDNPNPPTPGKHSKSLSEARIAGMGFVNTAADLVAGSGLQNAIDTSSAKYDLFGSINYADNKLKSGGGTNIKGTSMLLGFSRKLNTTAGNWLVGAFLESGNSSYDTSDSYDGKTVAANGKNNYFGGGLMARNSQDNGVYVEGSVRVGRLSTDYNSYDIGSKYDIKSTYYGVHLGLGKILKTSEKTELDVYGKYFWSHQNSASAVIKGDTINFDSLDSNRLRIGTRLNMLGGRNGLKTYVGLAYEHEFSGSARAHALGSDIAAPIVKGGTGIGEIGLVYKPSSKSAFSVDVGLNGYVGKRQGIGGGFKLNWGF